MTLAAVELPSIIKQPTKEYINLGGSVSFSIETNPAPDLTYEWRKVGGNLPPSYRCKGFNRKKLTISDIEEEDAGLYYCRVKNSHGAKNSDKAKLAMSECQFTIS